jgi:hypothetical protein
MQNSKKESLEHDILVFETLRENAKSEGDTSIIPYYNREILIRKLKLNLLELYTEQKKLRGITKSLFSSTTAKGKALEKSAAVKEKIQQVERKLEEML